ncbi:hypothetical protein BOTBODRAFT_67219 [Botryobasidium botryosum FD-172 SS1]|uniref:REM-1 domain-containing protein n=1 Tax=Botryobasidium botryosum (strain FD-172 SS1) TaxID=930990 RepID=A0A067MDI5_BOTB1|nr:hypothetical protein BOTBODRAFT_67219 [Botryobasidium botryosum FD-172 SS1]
MSFTPQHQHPFTFQEAISLSPEELSGEISRLEHSLEHLRKSQIELQTFIEDKKQDGSTDPEVSGAIEENEGVIASQEERIRMLRIVLEKKGGANSGSGHYRPALASLSGSDKLGSETMSMVSTTATAGGSTESEGDEEEGDVLGGVHL